MIAAKLVRVGLIALAVSGVGCKQQVSFQRQIHPILESRCMSCHSPGGRGCVASGFSVATYRSLMRGTKFGPVIIPGSSVNSTLVWLINHRADPSIAMPKSHDINKPSEWLTLGQIKLIEAWINQGAKDN